MTKSIEQIATESRGRADAFFTAIHSTSPLETTPSIPWQRLNQDRTAYQTVQELAALPLPNPDLPFNEKWADAERLPVFGRAAFVGEEVNRLNRLAGGGDDWKPVALGCFGSDNLTTRLKLTVADIQASSLPQPLKDYLSNAPAPVQRCFAERELRFSSQWGTAVRYDIELGTVLEPFELYWVKAYGGTQEIGSPEPNLHAKIEPKNEPLDRMGASYHFREVAGWYQRYVALDAFMIRVGRLAVARELVRFATGVVEARTPAAS